MIILCCTLKKITKIFVLLEKIVLICSLKFKSKKLIQKINYLISNSMAVNKVLLIGNVGRDPEVRYINNDTRVANFTLATTDRGFTTRTGVVVPEKTEWHNIVLWRGLAEVAEKYVRKGSKIFIEGKITSRSYEDKTGIKRYVTEILGENLELLDKKPASESGYNVANYGEQVPPPIIGGSQGYTPNYSAPSQETEDVYISEPEENSDLPF
jgi:single-strand DNA-binding protein